LTSVTSIVSWGHDGAGGSLIDILILYPTT